MKKIEKTLKYKIKNHELLDQVFTHKSYIGSEENNERLEFLGDAVLNLVIADLLMKKYSQASEGELTKKRSQLVSGTTLAEMAEELDFPKYLKTREESYKNNPKILAGALEAYVGAVYLEGGFLSVKKLVTNLFQKLMDQKLPELNYKSVLQEWCQKKYGETPIYKVKKEKGLDHKKTFFMEVFIQGEVCGLGSSHQKKQAEQESAKQALKKLKIPVE